MTLPFDDEVILEDVAECIYEVEVDGATSATELLRLTRDRLAEGRRLRPNAEHSLVVVAAPALSVDLRVPLVEALADMAPDLVIEAAPSWRAEGAALVAAREAGWDHIAAAFERRDPLTATVLRVTADGLLVDVGRHASLPLDQVDLTPIRGANALVGRKLAVEIVRFDVRLGLVVVSRRQRLERQRDALARETRSRLREGAQLRGRVVSLTSYGAFVDLGGVTALVHADEMPALAGRRPAELLWIGEELDVRVVSYRQDIGRIELSLPS